MNSYAKTHFATTGEGMKERRGVGEEYSVIPQSTTIIEHLLYASSFHMLLLKLMTPMQDKCLFLHFTAEVKIK